jgi:hypothetical protein
MPFLCGIQATMVISMLGPSHQQRARRLQVYQQDNVWRRPALTMSTPVHRRIRNPLLRYMAEDDAVDKAMARKEAECRRKRTQDLVNEMASNTPENRIAAAKARAASFYAKVEETNARAELEALQPAVAVDLADIRIDDLSTLFAHRERLPEWLRERIKKIHAKVHWKTQKGQKSFFNQAVHDNDIPLDKFLAILAHIHGAHDGGKHYLDGHIDAVVECGLFPKVKRGIFKRGQRMGKEHLFHYGRRCQDGEHCDLCNYLNISDGLKTLLEGYDEAAFYRGVNWFAFTIAPRTDPAQAKAVGRTLTPEDWERENSNSVVFRESHYGRVFVYPDAAGSDQCWDWEIEARIRCFLGAAQSTLGKLVKNGWLDGVRARVENSIQFLPYASHQHWHGVGSSDSEHDPQKMAEFIKAEVDAILAETCPGLYADVMVAVIPQPDDLRRWVRYMNKIVNIVEAVESVYSRHPHLRRTDELFQELYEELRLYPERSHRVFDMKRFAVRRRGIHTYALRRRYVSGNHKFGDGSILSESERHLLWREDHAETEGKRRGRVQKSQTLGVKEEKVDENQPGTPTSHRGSTAARSEPRKAPEHTAVADATPCADDSKKTVPVEKKNTRRKQVGQSGVSKSHAATPGRHQRAPVAAAAADVQLSADQPNDLQVNPVRKDFGRMAGPGVPRCQTDGSGAPEQPAMGLSPQAGPAPRWDDPAFEAGLRCQLRHGQPKPEGESSSRSL